MKRKVGFTLVELLAVIAILAILVIIALPNVMKMFNNAKKSAFETEVREIYINAKQQWMSDSLSVSSNQTYVKCKTEKCGKQLNMNTRNDLEYYIEMSGTGKVTSMYITDGTYQYKYEGTGLEKNDIGEAEIIAEIEDDIDKIAITCSGITEGKVIYVKPNPCTFNGDLVQGKEYTNGQYTYKYKQEYNGFSNSWNNMSNDGWGVKLTNLNSTENVNTKLCTSINDKPIVSMKFTFYNSKANNIDLSSFDTSNVTTFENMFYNCSNIKSLDLRTFNTSNVVNFQYMFSGDYNIEKLLIDNFDFSKISNMNNVSSMFSGLSNIKNISAKKWKIPKSFNSIIGCRNTSLCSNKLEYIDVSNWDLSETENINGLFGDYYGKEIKGLNTWKTPNLKDISNLFYNANRLESADLSSFDIKNVTNMTAMFYNDTSLKSINMDNLDFSNASSSGVGGGMIQNATSLKSISARNWTLPQNFEHWISRTWSGNNSPIETIDVTGWNLNNTKSIQGLFADSKSLKEIKGLNTWDTSNIKNMIQLFYNCVNLKQIDLSNFDMSNVTDIDQFLFGNNNLNEIITPKIFWNSNTLKISLNNIYKDSNGSVYKNITNNTPKQIKLIKDTNSYGILDTGKNVNTKLKLLAGASYAQYNSYDSKIIRIERYSSSDNLPNFNSNNIISLSNSPLPVYAWFKNGTIYYYCEGDIHLNEDASYMFYGFNKLQSINVETLNTSNTKNMSKMFSSVGVDSSISSFSLKGIGNWDTSNVTDMSYMFEYTGSRAGSIYIDGLSNLDVSKVKTMDHMFYGLGQRSNYINMNFDLSRWKTSSLENMDYLFAYSMEFANNVNINISNWDTSKVSKMNLLFYSTAISAKNITVYMNNITLKPYSNIFSYMGQDSNSIKLYVSNWKLLNDISGLFTYIGNSTKALYIYGLETWRRADDGPDTRRGKGQ